VIGELHFPTGHVVACDPLIIYGAKAFEQRIPAGSYPIELAIAHFLENSDQRVATALLRVASGAPRHWRMATWAGQNPAKLKAGQSFGYGVDSGTGCFMDLAAAQRLERNFRADEHAIDQLIETMQLNYIPTRYWAIVTLDEPAGLDCAVFSSGIGDGFYTSYWGYDDSGAAACLMTDFGLLIEEDGA